MILDLHMHLKHDLKIWKAKLTELQGKIDKSIIIQGDFHMPFSIVDMEQKKSVRIQNVWTT